MQAGRINLRHALLLYLCVGAVCLLLAMPTGIPALRLIGGAILGTVLIPAMAFGPIMLLMRLTGWGLTRSNGRDSAAPDDTAKTDDPDTYRPWQKP
jgi:hypothetical protein